MLQPIHGPNILTQEIRHTKFALTIQRIHCQTLRPRGYLDSMRMLVSNSGSNRPEANYFCNAEMLVDQHIYTMVR